LLHPEFPLPPLPAHVNSLSTLDLVEWARWRWSSVTLSRMRDLSREQHQAFLRLRSPPNDERYAGCGDKADRVRRGSLEEEPVTTHYIVELDDLYHIITTDMRERAKVGGKSLLGQGLVWSVLGVHFHAETLKDLRARLSDLSPALNHLGCGPQGASGFDDLLEQRLIEGRDLLQKPYPLQLRAFARLGVPPSLRREVWAHCLPTEHARSSAGDACQDLQHVAHEVCTWEWLTDDVLRLDVAEQCANDLNYFPFDEIIEAMILSLSRDATVSHSCDCGAPQIPIVAHTNQGASSHSTEVSTELRQHLLNQLLVPPCGVVPFRGFSYYACPFAFLADKLEDAYPMLRAFYCRHLSRLHTISPQPKTLLPLCMLFESLVFTVVPCASFHLVQMGPEAAPLQIAFPWIVRGFVGFLPTTEVLWLWDRIVGFDSVDLSQLRALPLMQHMLFASELGGGDFECR